MSFDFLDSSDDLKLKFEGSGLSGDQQFGLDDLTLSAGNGLDVTADNLPDGPAPAPNKLDPGAYIPVTEDPASPNAVPLTVTRPSWVPAESVKLKITGGGSGNLSVWDSSTATGTPLFTGDTTGTGEPVNFANGATSVTDYVTAAQATAAKAITFTVAADVPASAQVLPLFGAPVIGFPTIGQPLPAKDQAKAAGTEITDISYLARTNDAKEVDPALRGDVEAFLANPKNEFKSYRLFPDAADPVNNKLGRNVVLVRVYVQGAGAGVAVSFRSFDVDSAFGLNGDNGNDNHGRLGATLHAPAAPAAQGGYAGQLRAVDGQGRPDPNFAAAGAVVTAKTFVAAGATYAEVELLTSFAPGDNFRVAASLDPQAVAGLTTTAPAPAGATLLKRGGSIQGFKGVISDELTIWRRVHIEKDLMQKAQGDQLGNGQVNGVRDNGDGTYTVTTNLAIPTAGLFVGGILRAGNNNYTIISHPNGAAPAKLTVVAGANPLPRQTDAATLYDESYWPGNGPLATFSGIDDQLGNGANEHERTVSTNEVIAAKDSYKGGVIAFGNNFYKITGNSTAAVGATVSFDIARGQAVPGAERRAIAIPRLPSRGGGGAGGGHGHPRPRAHVRSAPAVARPSRQRLRVRLHPAGVRGPEVVRHRPGRPAGATRVRRGQGAARTPGSTSLPLAAPPG